MKVAEDRVEHLEKQIDRLLVDIANLRDDAARWRTLHDEIKADLDKTTTAWAEAADERDQRRGERDAALAALKELSGSAEAYVNLSRVQGECLRDEAAHRVRNALATARELL